MSSVYRNILVPVDGSPHSDCALKHAIALARDQNARLTLMAVMPRPSGASSFAAGARESVCRGFESALRHATDSVPSDVPVTTLCLEGSPASRIIEQAKERGHDLIVMGSHGRGRLGDALLGSVSREVVHRSPVPVLIVRHDTDAQDAAQATG